MRESLPSRICFYLCFLGLLLCPAAMFKPYSFLFMALTVLLFIVLSALSLCRSVKLLVLRDGDTFRTVSFVIGAVSSLVLLFNLLAGTMIKELLLFFLGEVFFFSSALRQMRLDCNAGFAWKVKDLASLLLMMVCIISLSLVFWVLYGATGHYFIYILCPPLYILSKLLWLLSWALELVLSSVNWKTVKAREHVVTEREKTLMQNMDFSDMIEQFSDVEPRQTINPFYIVLGMLFVVMVCFVVYLVMRSSRSDQEKGTGGSVSRAAGSPSTSSRKSQGSFKGRSGRIRKIYKGYLGYLQDEKHKELDRTCTSEDVLNLNQGDDEALLRGLYIKARYSSHEISDSDVRQAAEAFGRMTGKAD